MIIIDTETTGLLLPSVEPASKQPRIIDLACVQLDPWTGEEVNRWESLINPQMTHGIEIDRITGYRPEDLRDAPTFAEVLPGLSAFFLGENCLCSHNLGFDRGLLYWELVRLDLVCAFPWPPLQLDTVQIGIEKYGGRRMHLTQLYEKVLGRALAQEHRALSDVLALVEIIRKEKLYELARP